MISPRSDPAIDTIPDFMVLLVTCKNEEDPIKNKGARVGTLFFNFSDAQRQLSSL